MAKQPRPRPMSDGTQPTDATPAYTVGYGRPPKHTRFKPGHAPCGGRPKRQRNVCTVVDGLLYERATFQEGRRQRTMSKHDAMWLSIVNSAAAGDHKAQMKVIVYLQARGRMGEPLEATKQEPFTADDEAAIADFLQRHARQVEAAQPPESTDKPETKEAKPQSKESKETKS
jgi:hypothetical protein